MKLSLEDYEYRRTESSVSSLNYHFIFVPKRRKAVLINDVAARLQKIVFELATEHNWKVIALEVMPDHVHLLVNTPTDEAPSQIAKWIKGRSAKMLRDEFPELKKLPCMWSPSYFVSTTGRVSTDTIKKYVEGQRTK